MCLIDIQSQSLTRHGEWMMWAKCVICTVCSWSVCVTVLEAKRLQLALLLTCWCRVGEIRLVAKRDLDPMIFQDNRTDVRTYLWHHRTRQRNSSTITSVDHLTGRPTKPHVSLATFPNIGQPRKTYDNNKLAAWKGSQWNTMYGGWKGTVKW